MVRHTGARSSAGKALLQQHSTLFLFFGFLLENVPIPDLFFTCPIGNNNVERRGLTELWGFLFNCAQKDKLLGFILTKQLYLLTLYNWWLVKYLAALQD